MSNEKVTGADGKHVDGKTFTPELVEKCQAVAAALPDSAELMSLRNLSLTPGEPISDEVLAWFKVLKTLSPVESHQINGIFSAFARRDVKTVGDLRKLPDDHRSIMGIPYIGEPRLRFIKQLFPVPQKK